MLSVTVTVKKESQAADRPLPAIAVLVIEFPYLPLAIPRNSYLFVLTAAD